MKLLYFVRFLTILCLSESIIRETELKVSNTVINFEEFGFHSGGSYRIEITNLTSTETSSRMVIVDSVDYHLIENQKLSCDKIENNSDYYFDVQQINGERLYTNSTFKKSEDLAFCLTNCDSKSIDLKIKYTFLNPNGEHLSSGLILVPKIYFFSIFFYCFLLLFWLINWFKFRGSKLALHRCVSVLIVLKEIESIVLYFYWSYNSRVGIYNFAIVFIVSIYEVCCDVLLYFILLLIAHGLSIVTTNLNLDTYCMLIFLSTSVVIFIQIELILTQTVLKLIFLFICAFSFFCVIKQVISLKYIWTYYFFVFVTDLILYYGIGYTFCFRELGMFQEQDDHQHHNPSQPDNVNFQKNDHQQSNPDFNINKNDNIDNYNTGDEDDVEYNKYKSNNEDLKDSPKPEPIVKKPNSELEMDEHIPLMILGNASIDDLKTTNKIEKMGGLSDSVLNNKGEDKTDSQFTIAERNLQKGLTNELIIESERKVHSNISLVAEFSDERRLLNENN
ncbi:lung seven transmembrane receptor [Anaeramoeba flamelloides]|uniref:Lung seven transmembrane receptor n=1 Tax=Anaeramoeba flamelloides TaxID=1746091 RepID=A0ABQ8YQB4_9EUKA|nr:lung seven transmembrane receptor [Anaeramoeba flamelloides]